MKLYIILSILLISLQLISSKKAKSQDPLFYYKRYQQRRSEHTKSPQKKPQTQNPISTQQKFENEHKLHEQHYNVSKKILDTKHKSALEAHKLAHEKSVLNHKKNAISAELMATNQISSERLQAIKSDINNSEKYREYYQKELEANQHELKVGSVYAKHALKKLVKFDKIRVDMYASEETSDQQVLEKILHEDVASSKDLMAKIQNLDAKIGEMKKKLVNKAKHTKIKTHQLKEKESKIKQELEPKSPHLEYLGAPAKKNLEKFLEKMAESEGQADSDGEDVVSIETYTPVRI